jgi:hypothetical protein
MERETTCEVLARKTASQNGLAYSEGFVLSAPADLPDGEYLVKFDHHILRATKQRGIWLTSRVISRENS